MNKIAKRVISVMAAVSITALAFSAENTDHHGKFYNKISSGIVNIDTDTGATTFAGMKDKVFIDVLSGRVDAGITASFTLKSLSALDASNNEYKYLSLGNGDVDGFTLEDWYLEFRPLKNPDIFTIGFHDVINFAGSYLPIADANFSNGNFGSDVVFVLRPIKGVRIAAGFDLTSFFGFKTDVPNQYPVFNMGADWTYADRFSVGLAIRNPINAAGNNDMGFGLGLTFNPLKNLGLSLGYSYNDEDGIADLNAANLLTFGATASASILSFAFDFAAALPVNEASSDDEIYLAFDTDAAFTDSFDAGLTLCAWFDADKDSTNQFEITPYANYAVKNHKFGAAVDVLIAGKSAVISFPVYWKVSF
jgi:hypothetical protein